MCLMIEPVGSDKTMWVLPDGDYISGELVMVDTTDWSLDDFRSFDECPPENRVGLAKIFEAIRKAEVMSVVEITIPRG